MASEVIVINGQADTNGTAVPPVEVNLQSSDTTLQVEIEPGSSIDANIEINELGKDAWGRHKTIKDHSLFHALFTYDIPNRIWEEFSIDSSDNYTALPVTGTNAASVLGELHISSGSVADEGAVLLSKRHPRYQPNRGHLYSTAGWFPDPELEGTRKWGLMCGCLAEVRRSGVYFEIEGDGVDFAMYVVLKSYGVIKERKDITSLLPSGFDVTKGALYDIQFQWRGVGNYKFFINQELIYEMERLQQDSSLTLWNPSLSIGYEVVTLTTTPVEMRFGCADVTSEGGSAGRRSLNSVSTGEDLIDVDNTIVPVIAVRVPRVVDYNGVTVVNTRDLVINNIITWTRDESGTYVYLARDTVAPNLDGMTWGNLFDSPVNTKIGGKSSALDSAFNLDKNNLTLVMHEWDDTDVKNRIINRDQDVAPFNITAGDILVIAVRSISGTDENASTVYLSEEI